MEDKIEDISVYLTFKVPGRGEPKSVSWGITVLTEWSCKPASTNGLLFFFYQERNRENLPSGQTMLSLVSSPHCSLFPEDYLIQVSLNLIKWSLFLKTNASPHYKLIDFQCRKYK